MKTLFIIIGFALLADALFAWANMDKVSHIIKNLFPKINIRTFILVEGIAGSIILLSQLS